MDSILQQIHLGTLVERFKEEKIEVETVLSATDNELIRLGVQTIGDRVRLRELCRKNFEENANQDLSSTPGTSGESMSSRIRSERSLLFSSATTGGSSGRRSRAATGNRRQKNAGVKRTWTAQFMCLADRFAIKVPNASEKQILSKAGLGAKKIKFEVDDDEQKVTNKIMSDVKDNDGVVLGFPQLQGIGGFEMLHCLPNCRDLRLIDCSWSVKDLKSNVGSGQSKIYLRPIQASLSTKSLIPQSDSSLTEKCKYCNREILMRKLRDHLFTCAAGLLESESSEDEIDSVRPDADSSQREVLQVEGTTRGNLPVAERMTNDQRVVNQGEGNTILPVNATVSQNDHVTVDLTHADGDDKSGNANKTVDDLAQEAVDYCKAQNIGNHVEILRYLQSVIVYGRSLEIQNTDELAEGETNYILVDRNNLINTSFDEISALEDLRKTLEVQFYNEAAEDYGGPRKEFFRLVIKEIKEKFFDNGLREHMAEQYNLVGIIFGLSILQNGKIPQFMPENIVHAIFSENEASASITNLREGFVKMGIYQVGCQLPTFLEVFQPTQATLTLKVLTTLLKPKFSEDGSNSWRFERAVYSAFLKYLREAAAGRRNNITLAYVLQFATGAEDEPVLGFSIHPSLEFYEASSSFLPTSSTCSNCLKLPRPSHEIVLPSEMHLFVLYDYAFSNAYFGNR